MTPPPSTQITKAHRMSYRIGRGEQLVLTFEPYKSEILPHWRFKTPAIARRSAKDIWNMFLEYDGRDDFVGMDMCRKFLQMGMTRAKRYANYAGGRKYDKATGDTLEKGRAHKGAEEKMEASGIFKEAWERAKVYEGYVKKKAVFQAEQKQWDKERKMEQKNVKEEEGDMKEGDEDPKEELSIKKEGKDERRSLR